ncbi:MAG: hypothetical protein HYS12_02275 [Planctomycetes bacterium]|nr:hypothetical protein [Planctomycetota bacterium]
MRARCVLFVALLALTVLAAPVRSADDKTKTPTLIVRVQSLDGLIADARYLATLAGREEEAKQAEAFLKQFTGEKGIEGLDTKQPMGLYGYLAGNLIDTQAVVLLPVADEQTFVALLKRLNLNPDKDKDGIYSVQLPRPNIPAYFRFANKYVYVTVRDKDVLEEKRLLTPAVVLPAKEVGTASATLNLESFPKELRDLIVGQFELRLGDLKEKKGRETEAQHALRVKTIDEVSGTLKSLLEDGGSVTVQLRIDQQANDLSLSGSLAGRPGTTLAKKIKALADTESAVAGLIGSESAMGAHLTVALPDAVRTAMGPTVDEAVKTMLAQAKDATARELAERYAKALVPTIKDGTLDVAADLRGSSDDKLYTAVMAVRLKNTPDLDRAIRASVEKLPEKEREKVKLDAESVGNVKIHRLDVSKQFDPKAKELLGENPIYVAVRDDALFLAMGENGLKALHGAVKVKPKTVPLVNVEMSLSRLATLIGHTQKAAPDAARKAFGKDKDDDKVYLTLTGGKALQLRAGLKGPVIRFFSLIDKAEKKKGSDDQ